MVEGGSRLLIWSGFVPESIDSPVETAGTTRGPGLCLPPSGYAVSSEAPATGRGRGPWLTSGSGLHFAIITPQHSHLPDDQEVWVYTTAQKKDSLMPLL